MQPLLATFSIQMEGDFVAQQAISHVVNLLDGASEH